MTKEDYEAHLMAEESKREWVANNLKMDLEL